MTDAETTTAHRAGGRLAIAYMLAAMNRYADIVAGDRVAAMVFIGLMCRNVIAGEERGLTPAHKGALPIAPATIYKLAARLKMPYETTRRHVLKLESQDLCERRGDGFLIPDRVLFSPDVELARSGAWVSTRQLHRDLVALGLPLAAWNDSTIDSARIRVSRLMIAYVLELVLLFCAETGLDLSRALALLSINWMNIRHLGGSASDPGTASSEIPSDNRRRGISVLELAREMAFPPETARRHIRALIDDGYCERVKRGRYVVPARAVMSEPMVRWADEGWRLTERLMDSALAAVNAPETEAA